MVRASKLSCVQGLVSLFPVPNVLLIDVTAVWMNNPRDHHGWRWSLIELFAVTGVLDEGSGSLMRRFPSNG